MHNKYLSHLNYFSYLFGFLLFAFIAFKIIDFLLIFNWKHLLMGNSVYKLRHLRLISWIAVIANDSLFLFNFKYLFEIIK